MDQGAQAYIDQIPDQFWNPQFANVGNDHQEADQLNIAVPVDNPRGLPWFMMPHPMPLNQAQILLMPWNLAQRNNNIGQLIPFYEGFEDKIVLELLKSNDPDDRNQLNLVVADIARTGEQGLCALLFRNGYEVNVLNEKNQTMLHIAFHNNSQSIITTILDSPSFNNSSIDYADSSGLTHLHIACAFGNVQLAERYLRTGSDVNAVYQFDMTGESSNFTPLHFAVSEEKTQIVKLLLEYGADVNLTNLKGQTPLHLICCCDHSDANLIIMMDLVDNCYVNINARDKQGNTPLLSLFCDKYDADPFRIEFKIEEIESRFDVLMKVGADFTLSNKEGNTVLHLLIKNLRFCHKPVSFGSMSFNDTNFVRLIKKVLDTNRQIVNLKNKLDKTPLQLAVAFMSLDVVKLLLEYNASLDDLKIDHFYYPNVTPVFEPVQNLVSIVDLLSERGYTFSLEDNIRILTFMIHEFCNCQCLTYDSELASVKLYILLNFGSSRHVIDTLRQSFENEDVASIHNTFVYPLYCYLDLANTGKFYVDAEVKRFFKGQVSFYSMYSENPMYANSKLIELKQLESVVMKNEIKLYDMMLKDPHDISRLIKNNDFSPTFADTFPLYKDIVKGHITRALIRSYVESSTYEVLRHELFSSLPDLCCEMIMRFLSNLDILHMYTAAAHPPMTSR